VRLDRIEQDGFFHFGPRALDINSLPPGIIAVVGRNGDGKTSLLETAIAGTYYVIGELSQAFPIRPVPLASMATTRDAHLTTEWTLADGKYRCRVNVDGDTRDVDAVIHEVGALALTYTVRRGCDDGF